MDDSPLTKRATAAMCTLAQLGYTYHPGAELWAPPVNPISKRLNQLPDFKSLAITNAYCTVYESLPKPVPPRIHNSLRKGIHKAICEYQQKELKL